MKEFDPGPDLDEEIDDIYTVSELTDALRQNLETEFPSIKVIGEVANFKIHTSGHIYLTLRDQRNMIRVVIFKRYVHGLTFGPENGMLVIAKGRVSFYGGSGQTQIIALDLENAGRGSLELDFRKLLQRLMEEGLTDPERKRSIPAYPRRIAVITSMSGAVIRDIRRTIERRWPVAEIVHVQADVQGSGSADSIVKAFAETDRMDDIDVVILSRGGGSIEDLWGFNLEKTARAVAGSVHPVITGIGHEIDTTVCDYVSDLRAATPTAAAELCTPSSDDIKAYIEEMTSSIAWHWKRYSRDRYLTLDLILRSSSFPGLKHRIESSSLSIDDRLDKLGSWWDRRKNLDKESLDGSILDLSSLVKGKSSEAGSKLSEAMSRLALHNPEARLLQRREMLKRLLSSMRSETSLRIELAQREMNGRLRTLQGLSPLNVLGRGYAYCTDEKGEKVIGKVGDIEKGDRVKVNFNDGTASCLVEKKRKGSKWPKK